MRGNISSLNNTLMSKKAKIPLISVKYKHKFTHTVNVY